MNEGGPEIVPRIGIVKIMEISTNLDDSLFLDIRDGIRYHEVY